VTAVRTGANRAFLKREELPDGVTLSLSVVRMLPVGAKNFYIIGGGGWTRIFLPRWFYRRACARSCTQPRAKLCFYFADGRRRGRTTGGTLCAMIEEIQKQPQPLIRTINWSQDAAETETFHAMR